VIALRPATTGRACLRVDLIKAVAADRWARNALDPARGTLGRNRPRELCDAVEGDPPVDKRIHPAETHLSDAFTFAEVWDIFGISQNTGYKSSQRWKESGKWGPGDRSLTECSRCLGRPSHDYGPPADVLDDRVLA